MDEEMIKQIDFFLEIVKEEEQKYIFQNWSSKPSVYNLLQTAFARYKKEHF